MGFIPGIKVCGMRQANNIEALVALQPDYMGFIFYKPSPRYVGEQLTQDAIADIPGTIQKVGVFVNAPEREIDEARIRFGLDILQLHGDESPELCFLMKQTGARVMKVFRVDDQFEFAQTRRYEDYCDYFLFDTATKAYGGSGHKFNWQLLQIYNNVRPVFLSGGIGPEDVEDILHLKGLNLKGIDVNSKFETEPGLKDIDRLKSFMEQVRSEVWDSF